MAMLEGELGLRERKKLQTRRALAEAALQLYRSGGLDAVTVEAITREVDVSPRTFFKYFPTKEDVFLGDTAERMALLMEAIRDRDHSKPLLGSVRLIVENLASQVLAGTEGDLEERRDLLRHPSITRRLRERWDTWEDELARVIAKESGFPANAPEPSVVAAAIVGAFRAFVAASALRPSEEWSELASRAFDLLASGLGTFGMREQ